MNLQFDPLSRNINLFRNLSSTLLSGSEELMSWQIDSAQSFLTRGSQQLKAALADAGSAQEPAHWPETVQSGMRNAIRMTRDCLVATTDYQMEAMRLLHEQGAETQKLITAALNEQLVNIDVVGSREKRSSGKATTLAQKLAA